MINSTTSSKKDLNFELNLMPVFDILSVCICFLLMTVAWLQIGSLDVKQAMGGQSQAETQNPPSVWAYLNPGGDVVLQFKDVPVKDMPGHKTGGQLTLKGTNGAVNWSEVGQKIQGLRQQIPKLNTALVMPSKQVRYEDIIQLMDQFKRTGMQDIGIFPL